MESGRRLPSRSPGLERRRPTTVGRVGTAAVAVRPKATAPEMGMAAVVVVRAVQPVAPVSSSDVTSPQAKSSKSPPKGTRRSSTTVGVRRPKRAPHRPIRRSKSTTSAVIRTAVRFTSTGSARSLLPQSSVNQRSTTSWRLRKRVEPTMERTSTSSASNPTAREVRVSSPRTAERTEDPCHPQLQ